LGALGGKVADGGSPAVALSLFFRCSARVVFGDCGAGFDAAVDAGFGADFNVAVDADFNASLNDDFGADFGADFGFGGLNFGAGSR
jgi:hypothetical protein